MQVENNDRFEVQEIQFQEGVEVAEEEFGDALQSLELGDAAGATMPSAEDRTVARETAAREAATAPTPAPGFFGRLLRWLLGGS